MKMYNLSGAAAPPEPKPQAQELSRHTPRAAANHLSPAEIKKLDEQNAAEDAAALAKVQASRLPKPPHRHVFAGGSCKVCALPEALL